MSKETTTPKLEYKTVEVEDNGQPRAARRIRSRHSTMTKAATQGFIHAIDADEEEGGASSPNLLAMLQLQSQVITLQSNYNLTYPFTRATRCRPRPRCRTRPGLEAAPPVNEEEEEEDAPSSSSLACGGVLSPSPLSSSSPSSSPSPGASSTYASPPSSCTRPRPRPRPARPIGPPRRSQNQPSKGCFFLWQVLLIQILTMCHR